MQQSWHILIRLPGYKVTPRRRQPNTRDDRVVIDGTVGRKNGFQQMSRKFVLSQNRSTDAAVKFRSKESQGRAVARVDFSIRGVCFHTNR